MDEERLKCPRGAPPVVRLALKREKCPRGIPERLRSPIDIASYMKREYGCEAQEWAVTIGVSAQGAPLGIHEVALGGMTMAAVDAKVVFSGLLLMGATSFIFFHNHPSGSPEPSGDDHNLTNVLKRGAEILGIRMLDHIIVAGTQLHSYQQSGSPIFVPIK